MTIIITIWENGFHCAAAAQVLGYAQCPAAINEIRIMDFGAARARMLDPTNVHPLLCARAVFKCAFYGIYGRARGKIAALSLKRQRLVRASNGR